MSLPHRIPGGSLPVAGRPSWLHRRLDPVVATFAPDTRTRPDLLFLGAVLVGAVLGWRAVGPAGAVVGFAIIFVVPACGPRLVVRRRREEDRKRLPERCATIARAVRSGEPLHVAVGVAFTDDLPAARRWKGAMRQVELGRPFDDALADLADRSHDGERLLVAGLRIGARDGGAVAAATGALSHRLRQEGEVIDRRRVLTTQARTSAQVLAALPVAFAATMAAVRGTGAWTQPVGVAGLGVGVVLNVVGVLWMRRLLGRLL